MIKEYPIISNEDLTFTQSSSVYSKQEEFDIPSYASGKGYLTIKSNNGIQVYKFQSDPEESSDSSEDLEEISLNGSWPYLEKISENITEECFDFCNSQGLVKILEQCLEKVKEIFEGKITHLLSELDFFVDDEPEDIGHVVIRLELDSTNDFENQEELWDIWFIDNVNDYARSKIILDICRG